MLVTVTSSPLTASKMFFYIYNVDMCITGQTRLLLGDVDQYVTNTLPPSLKNIEEFFTYNDTLLAGRVEYCSSVGNYDTFCGDSWTNSEASVVCITLGLSPYGKTQFITYIVPMWYNNLDVYNHRCSGSYKWCLSPRDSFSHSLESEL